MPAFLKSTVDEAADQRARISALYVLPLAATALAWTRATIAPANRPTLIGTAFVALVLGLKGRRRAGLRVPG